MTEPRPNAIHGPSGWTAWGATWLTMLAASLSAILVLAFLSGRSAREALEHALADHLSAQAHLTAASLKAFPVELLASLGGERTAATLRSQLGELGAASGLHDLAVMGPETIILRDPDAESWIAGLAEQDLIEEARRGATVTGPLYRGADGAPYLTAYAPLPGHAGWIVAVEGSADSLGALDALRRLQLLGGMAVLLFTGLMAAGLARWVVAPIRRLDGELSAIAPGDPPEALSLQGPREVRDVAAAARHLLAAIRARDTSIRDAHRHELDQLSRMAAEVAHEVRNPLNAIGLSVGQLRRDIDLERRTRVADRIGGQLQQLEVIVQRLVDVARPLQPDLAPVALTPLARALAEEMGPQGITVRVEGPAIGLQTDAVMLVEVLRNLCLNAHQAGAQAVDITLSPHRGGVAIDVQDDGPGIPPGDERAIFEWFHTGRAQGSGLGLPTSRRMAVALGGDLALTAPRPARFRLTLPGPLGPDPGARP